MLSKGHELFILFFQASNFTILLLDFFVQLSSNNKMLEKEDNSQ